MLVLAQKWANWMDANPGAIVWQGGPEDYDGGRGYEQVAGYVSEPKWYGYADKIHVAYAAQVNAGHGMQGYNVFSKGLLLGWQRTKNPAYAAALTELVYGKMSPATPGGLVELRYMRKHGSSTHAIVVPVNPLSSQWNPWELRESAYITNAMMDNERMTGKRHPLLLVGANDCVIPDLQAFMDSSNVYNAVSNPKGVYLGSGAQTSVPRTPNAINNFMVGLALETLIDYYALTSDPAIPPFVKTVLDFFWSHCVELSSGAQYYNSDPINGLDPTGKVIFTASALNQLVSPAFAWYWKHSGDATYLTRGDLMFAAGVNGAGSNCALSIQNQNYTFSGKEFSQNYKWSFDYVAWRS